MKTFKSDNFALNLFRVNYPVFSEDMKEYRNNMLRMQKNPLFKEIKPVMVRLVPKIQRLKLTRVSLLFYSFKWLVRHP